MQAILDKLQANKELQAVATQFGLTLRDLMYDQGRLLCQDAIKKIAPGKPGDGTAAQKKSGLSAVSKDINKIILGYDGDTGRSFLQDMANSGLGDQFYSFKTKTGSVYGVDQDFYRPSISLKQLEAFHNRQRSKKTGRVTTAGQKTRNIGRWKFVDKMHIPQKTKKKYVLFKQKNVGQLKAGFIPAVNYFASLAKTSPKKIPAWVKKQSKQIGSYTNGVNQRTGVGFIVASNNVPYAKFAISKGTVNALERTRNKDIEEQAIKRFRKVTKKHNEKYARAA